MSLYLSQPPTKQDLTQGQMTRRSDYSGGLEKGRSDPNQEPTPASHQPTYCNVGLMSLAGHGPKHGSRQRGQIIA